MENTNQNQKKYDISKSNFFANIESDNKKDEPEKPSQTLNSGVLNNPNNQNIPNSNIILKIVQSLKVIFFQIKI